MKNYEEKKIKITMDISDDHKIKKIKIRCLTRHLIIYNKQYIERKVVVFNMQPSIIYINKSSINCLLLM